MSHKRPAAQQMSSISGLAVGKRQQKQMSRLPAHNAAAGTNLTYRPSSPCCSLAGTGLVHFMGGDCRRGSAVLPFLTPSAGAATRPVFAQASSAWHVPSHLLTCMASGGHAVLPSYHAQDKLLPLRACRQGMLPLLLPVFSAGAAGGVMYIERDSAHRHPCTPPLPEKADDPLCRSSPGNAVARST